MKLGIVSDCVHYRLPDGRVATENHIFLKQMQALTSYYSAALMCCPFAQYDATKVVTAYTTNIQFLPLPVVGGDTFAAKVQLLLNMGRWLKAFRQIDRFSNIVYQRFPNNLNIPGFFYFWLKKKKVFGTYTGTWSRFAEESRTYQFQRWLLRNLFRGPVWVYSNGALNGRIHNGFSPSYSHEAWQQEAEQVKNRIEHIETNGLKKLRLITVGTLIGYKNQLYILQSCLLLKQRNIPFSLTIVGDGPMRDELENYVAEHALQNEVFIAGKKNADDLRALYRQHDFVVQAPTMEGFGKVPIEGLFHGLVPVLNNITMAAYITSGERGFLFDATKQGDLADTLLAIGKNPALLPQMIKNGRDFAASQTLEAWSQEYFTIVSQYFEKN